MAWNKAIPVSGTLIVDIPGVFEGNWTECEYIQGVGHYTYTNALSGRHLPGKCGLFLVNDNATIMALTGMDDGALAWDTDNGIMWYYSEAATAWVQLDTLERPALDAYRNGDQTVASGTSYTTVGYNTVTTDPLSILNTTTSKVTIPANGFYLIVVDVVITPTESSIDQRVRIQHDNSSDASRNASICYQYSLSTDDVRLHHMVIFNCTAGDKLYIGFYHDNETSQVIQGGSDLTFLKIYRLS